MTALRTPDSRFENLPGYDFDANYVDVEGLRVAAENERRFARIAIGNGGLPTGDQELPKAFDAPFPSAKYKAGSRAFPKLVPSTPNDPASEANRAAWLVLGRWQKPFLTTFNNRDPITRGGEKYFQEAVPGASNREHVKIKNAGHFLQEDSGSEIAEVLIEFIYE